MNDVFFVHVLVDRPLDHCRFSIEHLGTRHDIEYVRSVLDLKRCQSRCKGLHILIPSGQLERLRLGYG